MDSCFLFALCLLALTIAASNSLDDPSSNAENLKLYSSKGLEEEWKAFKINYDKNYKDEDEEKLRKDIFAKNLEAIEAHNSLVSEEGATYTMGINSFSDLETSEFIKLYAGYESRKKSAESRSSNVPEREVSASLADKVNWIDKGCVTPVKSQKRCGSCWAFSATGTLEGQYFRKTGKLVSLSEQQLVDCSTQTKGCSGGWPDKALNYIARNGGIATEESYPYEGVDGPCRYNSSTVGATCKGFIEVLSSEVELERAVAEIGPISVAIAVRQSSFIQYKDGIYNDQTCIKGNPDHAVLVVGYGRNPAGKEYWIVKNSWGTKWGNEGYIFMAKNKDNLCGISDYPVYALV